MPVAILTAPFAQAGTNPPYSIDGGVPDDATFLFLDDEQGNVKELGPLNSNTTKIGVIHNDVPPTLGLTNPNGQVDLRGAWIDTRKDSEGDDWIYFAWERDSANGSGFIAYEFMANAAPTACGTYEPTDQQVLDDCNPWANRAADDFIILWDQQGGSLDLFLRTWTGTAPDLVLSAPVAIPSTYGLAAYSEDGFFGEAAINITDAIYGGTQRCLAFANIIPSTVTGNSDTADYKDTILRRGISLSNCTTTTTTTPQDSAGAPIPAAGVSITTAGVVEVKDSALITLAGGSATPGGTIDFTLCEASNPANADCDAGGASVLVDDDKAVTDVDGAYPVTVVSSSAWVTSAGRYCWKATYTGVPAAGIGGSSDVSTGECFKINPVTPTLTTSAGADVVLGSAVTDTATLTGTAPQPTTAVIHTSSSVGTRTPAGGTIAFTLWGPSASGCGNQVTAANDSVTVSGDSSATQIYSTSYTPGAAGNYHWKATYTGNSPNTLGASHNDNCTETAEDVTVGPASTTTVTTPRQGTTAITGPVAVNTIVNDHALVTGTSAGGSPTGTVSFWICNPSQVTGAAGAEVCASGDGTAVSGNPQALTAGASNTATAVSGNVTANAVGVWCFRAVYTSDTPNYTGSGDATHGECFTVKDSTSTTSLQEWLPNDEATITATGGTALNGNVAITLYDSDDCTGDVLRAAENFTFTNATTLADRTVKTTNTNVFVTATNTVSWKVVFTSSDPLVDGSQHCEVTALTITN